MAYDLVGTQTLSSNASQIEFTNIPAGYKDLQIYASLRTTDTASSQRSGLALTFNNDSGASKYSNTRGYAFESGYAADQGSDTVSYIGSLVNSSAASNYFSPVTLYISNYATSNNPKAYTGQIVQITATSSYYQAIFGTYSYNSASAISSIQLSSPSVNLVAGSTATLYAIK
jgi:hypothetical protein